MNPETTPADDEPPSCRDPIYLIFSGICHNYKGLGWKMTPSHPVFKMNPSLLSLRCDAKDLHSLLSIHITNIGTHMHYSQQNQLVVRAQNQMCLWNPNYNMIICHSLSAKCHLFSNISTYAKLSCDTEKSFANCHCFTNISTNAHSFCDTVKLFVVKLALFMNVRCVPMSLFMSFLSFITHVIVTTDFFGCVWKFVIKLQPLMFWR